MHGNVILKWVFDAIVSYTFEDGLSNQYQILAPIISKEERLQTYWNCMQLAVFFHRLRKFYFLFNFQVYLASFLIKLRYFLNQNGK